MFVRKKIPHLKCLENYYKNKWGLSGIMKKMNEGKYRVTRFACDNNLAKKSPNNKCGHLAVCAVFTRCLLEKNPTLEVFRNLM